MDVSRKLIVLGLIFFILFYGTAGAIEKNDLQNIKRFAEEGDSEFQYILAEIYFKGHGVSQDIKKAVHWYEIAGNQGHKKSQFQLGCLYGTELYHLGASIYWFEMAADNGDPIAQFNLGVVYEKTGEYIKAFKVYSLSAEQGYPHAQKALGKLYLSGRGIVKNIVKGYAWVSVANTQLNDECSRQILDDINILRTKEEARQIQVDAQKIYDRLYGEAKSDK